METVHWLASSELALQLTTKEEIMQSRLAKLLTATAILATSAWAVDSERIARRVRHELVMLPYYSVFDNLTYKIDGSEVTLGGQVTRPTLRSGAERIVNRVEGVSEVVNEIEVLPVSSNDDRIRSAVYRAIYYQPVLSRYAIQSVPPIHIIVRNGDVTLEGVVHNPTERNIAALQANGVAGVFSVVNNLMVENRE